MSGRGAVLAIELSTARGSVAVVEEGEVRFESAFESKRSHNSQLFGPLGEALRLAGAGLRGVVVGTGPGSYTGVRIGIAAAQGVALSRRVPVLGMSSLLGATLEEAFVVVGDARRQQLYTAVVEAGRLAEAVDVFPADLWPERAGGLPEGLPMYSCDSVIPDAAAGATIRLAQPTAARLALRAWQMGALFWEEAAAGVLEPLYLQEAFITQPKIR